MCLIAYQPPGDKAFERSVLENGWDQNHHGAGYMFVDDDSKLIIRKPFFCSLRNCGGRITPIIASAALLPHFVVHFRMGDAWKDAAMP